MALLPRGESGVPALREMGQVESGVAGVASERRVLVATTELLFSAALREECLLCGVAI